MKQLLSKQGKTIVEHVHVLEEAKRVTDKQLQQAQAELERNNVYILYLKQSKSKASGEFEDLHMKFDKELGAKDQELEAQEKRMAEALALFNKERREKEEAELQAHRVLMELQQTGQQAEEFAEQLAAATRSKAAHANESASYTKLGPPPFPFLKVFGQHFPCYTWFTQICVVRTGLSLRLLFCC